MRRSIIRMKYFHAKDLQALVNLMDNFLVEIQEDATVSCDITDTKYIGETETYPSAVLTYYLWKKPVRKKSKATKK